MATKDEKDTTRGRANALRNALVDGGIDHDSFTSAETYGVMDLCLSCKACKTECPSSVDMAKLKTEFLAQYYDKHGTPFRARAMGHIHTLSRIGSAIAPIANLATSSILGRPAMKAMGVHSERKLSPFVRDTFTKQWARAQSNRDEGRPTRGKAVYFHDTFTTYNYPDIGLATAQLLEAAGFEVIVEEKRGCCGRPMISKGLVAEARQAARKNVQLLAPYASQGIPIIGSEPSCILTLRDEYLDLLPGDENAVELSKHVFMFDEFLATLQDQDELGIEWTEEVAPPLLFHGHCHQKALIGMKPSMTLLAAAGFDPRESKAGCCGMAGSFGYEEEHYEVSRKIGEERLFPAVNASSIDTVVSVAGVSCKQQIEHFTERSTHHIAEALASRIEPGHVWQPSRSDVSDSQSNGTGDYDSVLR